MKKIKNYIDPSSHSQSLSWSLCASAFISIEPFSNTLQKFLLWASNIQYIVLLLYGQFHLFASKKMDSLTSSILEICRIVSTVDLVGSYDYYGVNVFFLLLLWLYAFLLLSIFAVLLLSFRTNRKLFKQKSPFINFISQFHVHFGFTVVLMACIRFISNPELIDPSYVAVYKAWLIILIVIFSGTVLVFGLLAYNPFPSSDVLSIRRPYVELILFLGKAMIIPTIASSKSSDSYSLWYLSLSSLGVLILRYHQALYAFSYYNFDSLRVTTDFTAVGIVISLANLVEAFDNGSGHIQGISIGYIEILMIVLAIKLNRILINRIIKNNLMISEHTLKNENNVMRRVFTLRDLLRNTKSFLDDSKNRDLVEMQLKGLVISYDRSFSENLPESKQYITKTTELIQEILSDSIVNKNGGNSIKLLLSYFLISEGVELPKAITYLLEVCQNGGYDKLAALCLLQDFEVKQRKIDQNNVLDIKTFVDQENTSRKFTKMIHATCNTFTSLWRTYCTSNFELADFFQKSIQVEKADKKIKKYWDKHIKGDRELAGSLVEIFCNYLAMVRNAPYSAYKIEKTFYSSKNWKNRLQEHQGILAQENLESANNLILQISMSKKRMGTIIKASQIDPEYLGWTQEEFLGKNLSILMMPVVKESFDFSIVESSSRRKEMIKLGNIQEISLVTKKGFIKPAFLYTTIYPYIGEELIYLMMLRIRKLNVEIFVMNEFGILEGISETVANYLKISVNKKVSVESFCKNFTDPDLYISSSKRFSVNFRRKTSNQLAIKEYSISKELNTLLGKNQEKTIQMELFNPGNEQTQPVSQVVTSNVKLKTFENGKVYYIFGFSLDLTGTLEEKNTKEIMIQEASQEKSKETMDEFWTRQDSDNLDTPAESPLNKINLRDLGRLMTQRNTTVQSPRALLSPRASLLESDRRLLTGRPSVTMNSEVQETNTAVNLKSDNEEELKGGESSHLKDSREQELEFEKALEEAELMSNLSTGIKNSHAKIENAVYHVPKDPRVRCLTFLYLALAMVSGIMLIAFQIYNKKVTNSVAENTIIVSNSTRRLEKLVESNIFALRLLETDSGLLPRDRIAWIKIMDYKASTLILFARSNVGLKTYNDAIRDSIYKIAPAFQSRFFEEIPVIDRGYKLLSDSTRRSNSFGLIDEIISAISRFSGAATINISTVGSTNLDFILGNSLNQLLISGEDIVNIVIDDNDYKMDKSIRYFTIFAVISLILCITTVASFVGIIRKSRRERDKFIEILLRIDDNEISKPIIQITKFISLLEKYAMDGRRVDFSTLNERSLAERAKAGEIQYKRKHVRATGLDKKYVQLIFYSVSLTLVLYVGFSLVIPFVLAQNTQMRKTIDRIVDSDMAQYQSSLLIFQAYNYPRSNAICTIRRNSCPEQWDQTINMLLDIQTRFTSLAKELQNEKGNSSVYDLLTGNLCHQLVGLSLVSIANCPTALNGIITEGVLQLSNYMIGVYQRVRQTYDTSNKTIEAVYEALNIYDFSHSEPFMFGYWVNAYIAISDLLRDQLINDSKDFNNGFGKVIILWGVIFMVVGSFGWWRIVRSFENEKASWQKVIRNVPINIIKNNKMLKTYISYSKIHHT